MEVHPPPQLFWWGRAMVGHVYAVHSFGAVVYFYIGAYYYHFLFIAGFRRYFVREEIRGQRCLLAIQKKHQFLPSLVSENRLITILRVRCWSLTCIQAFGITIKSEQTFTVVSVGFVSRNRTLINCRSESYNFPVIFPAYFAWLCWYAACFLFIASHILLFSSTNPIKTTQKTTSIKFILVSVFIWGRFKNYYYLLVNGIASTMLHLKQA